MRIEQRVGTLTERREQSGQLHHTLAGVSYRAANPCTAVVGEGEDLREQPALPHSGITLNDDDRPHPLGEVSKRALYQRKFGFAAMKRTRRFMMEAADHNRTSPRQRCAQCTRREPPAPLPPHRSRDGLTV